MNSRNERYHALDFLRAFAMFLGIVLHSALSFAEPQVRFWPIHDADRSFAVTVILVVIHDFRMQLFFVLAGLFGCLLYQRYGLWELLRHRARRIALPFALGLVTLIPILHIIWLVGDRSALRFVGFPVPEDSVSGSELVYQHFSSISWLATIKPLHLWFLYFLIVFYLAMIPLLLVGVRIQDTSLAAGFDRVFRRLLQSRWSGLLFAVLLLPALWSMAQLVTDTHDGWLPSWHLFSYYFFFFLFGWQLYRQRDLLMSYVRHWRSQLLIAHLVVLGPMLGFIAGGLEVMQNRPNPLPLDFVWVKFFAMLLQAVYTWLMISGLMGAFLHYFSDERKWVRYLADASYWCYLASLIPLILMQMLVASWELPIWLKLVLINGVSLLVLLASYEWCVRYTVVGTILNGRRHGRDVSSLIRDVPESGD